MNEPRKIELLQRALISVQVGRAKRAFMLKINGGRITPKLAKELRRDVSQAVRDYFHELGMTDIGVELAERVAVIRHRFEPKRYALCDVAALLPNGEAEDGDWDRYDDAPEVVA